MTILTWLTLVGPDHSGIEFRPDQSSLLTTTAHTSPDVAPISGVPGRPARHLASLSGYYGLHNKAQFRGGISLGGLCAKATCTT